MDTVILYGDKKDTQIKTLLQGLLSRKMNVNLISDRVIHSNKSNKKNINLIETSYLNEIHVKDAIVILKNNAKINAIKYIDKSTTIIINADNVKNITRLGKSLTHIYTCGFSSKDYATFSSKEEQDAVFSLQRSVVLNNKTICEPLEIPCRFQAELKDYSILATIFTMLLLGLLEESSGINL